MLQRCSTRLSACAVNKCAPLPAVFDKALGVHVWDPEGKQYFDFSSAHSTINQGHNHPRICDAMTKQVETLAHTSPTSYNLKFPKIQPSLGRKQTNSKALCAGSISSTTGYDYYNSKILRVQPSLGRKKKSMKFSHYADMITSITGYDRLIPANSGTSAKAMAMKIARKWACIIKGVPQNEALIIGCEQTFHDGTRSVISWSDDPEAWDNVDPFTPGLEYIPFDDISALEQMFEAKGDRIAAFFVEPIQGKAGVFVPQDGYLAKAHALCKKHNVLLIADEVQTGFGRTGKLFCSEYDEIKPDAIVMGKSLSGGLYPISGVVTNGEFQKILQPGTLGSTFGGSPIANAVAIESLNVLLEEDMIENSFNLGNRFRSVMSEWAKGKESVVKEVRGRGLLNAIVVDEDLAGGQFANQWCSAMAQAGILAKPTHGNIIQFSPALVLTSNQLEECLGLIKESYDVAMAQL